MHLLGRRKTKYISYAKTAIIASLFIAVAVPFTKKLTSGAVTYTPDERYMVVLNGEKLGYVSDDTVASAALIDARSRMNSESEGLALVEADIEVYTDNAGGAVLSQEELADSIYNSLSSDVRDTDSDAEAYTVRIDDFRVTLASKEDVSALLEKVKDKYSDSNEFTVELVEDNSGLYTSLKTNFVSADVMVNEAAKVLASENGTGGSDDASDEDVVYKDGVLSVDFAEDIEIIPTKASSADVVSIDEAYELITKEHAEKGTYTVSAGDSLYGIADSHNLTLDELFALNYGIDIDTTIYEGDLITVTVPASEISVVVVEEESYDEEYEADIEYVDNDSLYIGTENVIREGSSGERSVVALVTYVNGVESEREIIKETVTKEAVAKKVERGTLTPPTYIKPVNSTNITSPYGYRIHPVNGTYTLHSGVDWYVPTGTAVKASSSGTVVSAGWNGAYGYCVDISHPNGTMTRYAHLSSIAVAYGQSVTQGQVIAYSGATGVVTGPHLHFELYINGASVNPIDYVGN